MGSNGEEKGIEEDIDEEDVDENGKTDSKRNIEI
jgi:hypothetical protein